MPWPVSHKHMLQYAKCFLKLPSANEFITNYGDQNILRMRLFTLRHVGRFLEHILLKLELCTVQISQSLTMEQPHCQYKQIS